MFMEAVSAEVLGYTPLCVCHVPPPVLRWVPLNPTGAQDFLALDDQQQADL